MQALRVTVDDDKTKMILLKMLRTMEGVHVKEIRQTENRNAGNALQQLSGIWKDRDISIEKVREKAWERAAK